MWIIVENQNDIPKDKSIIVEDINGWIGQAYWNDYTWVLESFNRIGYDIGFAEIKRYFIIPD